ncbi:MAG: hypothetical protein R2856_09920 [Caldilineaceae bacterium]
MQSDETRKPDPEEELEWTEAAEETESDFVFSDDEKERPPRMTSARSLCSMTKS